jgi:predicted membrane GTPase involved in stress response
VSPGKRQQAACRYQRTEAEAEFVLQEFTRHQGPMDQVRKGVLISMAEGNVTSYAMNDLQARGTLFVSSGEVVYSGMIVGESSTDDDLHVCFDLNTCAYSAMQYISCLIYMI